MSLNLLNLRRIWIAIGLGWTLLSIALPSSAQNQTAKATPAPGSIGFWEYLPPDYNNNTDKYPVVFFLHGLGEKGSDMNLVLRNGPPKHVKNGYKFPFILISPQLKGDYGSWPAGYIDAVIEYCKTYLRIDESRIYLTGLSLGGGGVWGYAQDPVLSKKLAAIAVVCGATVNATKACNLAATNLPVWAFHGDADPTVSVNKTINMVNAINACVPAPNPLAIKTIYPGVNHNSWDRAYLTDNSLHTPNVYQWMMQFRNDGIMVNAGNDATLNLPSNSITITGSATAEGGTITSYAWTKVSGPNATISNGSAATVTLSGLVEGTYVFRLTVKSSTNATAYDDVKITVLQANQAPTADAGNDISVTLPTNAVTIAGKGSDADGTIASYRWNKVSGPTVTTGGANTATLSLSSLLEGTYVFSLTVTDNAGASATDLVTVVVHPAAVNQLPVAHAGADQLINLPTNSTNLNGAGSDPDGSIAAYLWEKVSGPSVTLGNAAAATASLSALVAGVYEFRLTVTDNLGAKATDLVTITVVAANQPPVANAGDNIAITLPDNTVTITGYAADPDGGITSYSWTQAAGPATASLLDDNTAVLTVNNLIEGTYIFRLTVTDDKGSTAYDDVSVTVNAAPVNVSPVVNAGPDKLINLPTTSTNFNGSASDTDGSIVAYAWEKISGPGASLTNEDSPTLTVSDLVPGVYTFRLTATDDDGATSFDELTLTVAAANQAPVANAGNDIAISLPTNTTNINGSGSDADGSVIGYVWTTVTGPSSPTLSNVNTATLSAGDLIEGSYTFRLTVTDDDGATAFDDVNVVVTPAAVNISPVANAGADRNISLPLNSVILHGSGTDSDGTISTYAWQLESGPPATLANENTADLTVSNLIAGTYLFTLTVTDNNGATDEDQVTIIVQPAAANQSPLANGGPDVILTLPANMTSLSGSGTDPDGTIVSYSWIQTGGPAATLADENTATLKLTDLTEGIYTFEFTVTDDHGATGADEVQVDVNAANVPPVVRAGHDITLNLPDNTATINGSATDADGSIASYQWAQVSGPNTATLTNENTTALSIADLVEGSYTFRLTAYDDDGDQGSDNVKVIVNAANLAPTANAGANKTITLPTNTITFNGTGIDTDGSIVSFSWAQLNGPVTAIITNGDTKTATITASTAGVYNFRLTITDNDGATDYDDVRLTVNPQAVNQAPVANAGPNQQITLPVNTLNLSGSGSDTDGTITGYKWVKVSGPSGVTLKNGNTPTLTLTFTNEGTYLFRLTVTDNGNKTASDEVTISVLSAVVNQAPVANAGADKTITLPRNSITITGSASDPDGTIASYSWTKVSGGSVTTSNTSSASLTLSDLLEGKYVFRLTVTDNDGATDTDDIRITVNAAPVNQPPVADAGTNRNLTLPVNTLNLIGLGTDPDGAIASYSWIKVSGPAVALSNETTSTVTLNNLVEGTYTFRLTVTDDDGASGSDDVIVQVQAPSVNQIPVANAGPDQVVTLPSNSITLFGSGSDTDGHITTYAWVKVSGPNATISNAHTSNLTLTNLEEGTYRFRLTVTDDDGAIDSDEVMVTVSPETTNQVPIANAGPDKRITLPVNSLSLGGSATDSDGEVVSYRWSKVSGPPVTMSATDQKVLNLSGLNEGTYIFRLQVEDNDGSTDTDDVKITVLSQQTNQSPTVDAGPDLTIIEPDNTVTITGTATDVDGIITSTVWTQVAGTTVSLQNNNTLSLVVKDLVVGTYRFRLTVIDDKSASSFDEVMITVRSSGENQPPVARAGRDAMLKLPVNTITLRGSGDDTDGVVTGYSWLKMSGPAATVTGENTDALTLSDMQAGIYVLNFTVTDDDGETGSDQVRVTVLPETFNLSPQVNAGPNITIELPEDNVVLQGSATDDGTITAVLWEKVSGPAASFSGENTNTLSVSNLTEGEYVFRFTVTDDGGLTDYDETTVVVLREPEHPTPPTVDAGEDRRVQMPEDQITITAVAESSGTMITSYQWTQLEGPAITIEQDTASVLVLTDIVPGYYVFRVTVTDAEGLVATDEVHVEVLEEEPSIKPRNLFSPDNRGDASTETWFIENAFLLNGCEIIVYNRQGQQVYASVGYQTPWDGTVNGKPVPDGAYFYVIRCAGQKSQSGSITIARLK